MTVLTARLSLLLCVLCALCVSTGCVFLEKDVDPEPPVVQPEPDLHPKVSGRFISGHLGSYDTCPQDAYKSGSARSQEQDGAKDIIAGGACEPADDGLGCKNGGSGYFNQCEDGQVMLRLDNVGRAPGRNIALQQVLLLDAYGNVLAQLPSIDVTNDSTQLPFNGSLAEGSSKTISVSFQAPLYPDQFLVQDTLSDAPSVAPRCAHSDGGTDSEDYALGNPRCGVIRENHLKIRVIFSLDGHPDVSVDSKAIYKLQTVVT